jgi:hypothetical protein
MATTTTPAKIDEKSWTLPLLTLGAILLLAFGFVHDDITSNVTQFALCLAAGCVLGWGYWLAQQARSGEFQVLRDRLLLMLGVGGALAYCNFGHLHFGNFIHVWDTYHYYMGAKYFPELKYDLLYDCAAIADSETSPELKSQASMRTITDLRTNVMHKAAEVVEHPEICKSQFTAGRWDDFKRDIAFFRGRVNSKRWEEIHQDHGYNGTPVWGLAGWALTNTGPATIDQVTLLNLLDPLYLALMGVLLYWAFGHRVFSIGMLVLGCNYAGRYYWTGGAFLRHDWLFYTVAVVCLLKKEKWMLAGLALSYATLLRLFPGLMVIGPLLAGIELFRLQKKLDMRFVKFVAGGAIGVAVLFPLSLALSKTGSAPAKPPPQGVLAGVVELGGQPYANAPLRLDDGPRMLADPQGHFRLAVTPGKHTMKLEVPSASSGGPPVEVKTQLEEVVADNEQLSVAYKINVEAVPEGSLPPAVIARAEVGREVLPPPAPPGPIDIWLKFAANTTKHASTPLTNHMGLRTILSYRPDTTGNWMRDGSQIDPWAKWKATRLEKFHQARLPFMMLLVVLAVLIYFAVRQTGGELWIAAALGIGYIVAGAELTNYYYCFMVGMAALHEKRREVGIILMVMLASTLIIAWAGMPGLSPQLDQLYTTMTVASLFACIGIWFLFTKRGEEISLAPEGEVAIWPTVEAAERDDDRKKKKRKK